MPPIIHIGIDGNEANVSKRVGSNQYAYSIIKALYEHDPDSKYTVYLKSTPLLDMPQPRDNWSYKVLKPPKLWTQWRLPLGLFFDLDRPNVFFSPGHYAPRFSPVPTVVSIMDLAFIKHPNLFLKYERGTAQLNNWTRYSVNQASHVIAISQNTKKDIIHTYGKKADQITVAYPGIDHHLYQPPAKQVLNKVLKKYQLNDDYLLYVGTIQPRKNLTRFLRAFESLPRTYKKLNWVIAGQTGWMYDNFLLQLKRSPKKELIKRIGYVDESDLPSLYAGAKASILIGLYEGFGMPAAESLACGTIPIVSKTSSLPEVVGKAGVTVDPYSITSVKRGLLYTLKLSTKDRQKRLKLGTDHIKQFDWSKSAKAIRKVLYEVAA